LTERRRFNARERVALYLATDGRCIECGIELESGWHADHKDPYSQGGPTDVINGQAMCPTCNLKKGSSLIPAPRTWQRRFIAKYHASQNPDFLCVACPAAGKTKGAGFIALDLLAAGEIDRLFIVVPSGPLRMQWHKALIELGIVVDGWTMNDPDHNKEGRRGPAVGEMDEIGGRKAVGWVVTYQSLAMAPELHRHLNGKKRTLAILDEVHHLSESGSWGRAAAHALGPCIRRLSLSGTPFRSDGAKIPFAEYDTDGWCRYSDRTDNDGKLEIYPRGFDYSYGIALSDKPSPVRPVVFEQFAGDVAWMEYGREDPREVNVADPLLTKPIRQKANKHILDAAGQWLRDVLVRADRRLTMVRGEGDDRAKGLVVCMDTAHAHEVVAVLSQIAGRDQVHVAVSRDGREDCTDEARKTIETFGAHPARWLVAVAMVSEGVDIPELRVGVYATTVRAALRFRQVLGRYVRWRSDLPDDVDQTAYLFIPKDPAMVALADGVQDEVRTAMLKEDADDLGGGGDEDPKDWQPTLDFDSFLSSTSEAGGILVPGLGSFDHDLVEKIATESGRPASVVAEILAAQHRLGVGIPEQRTSAEPARKPASATAETVIDQIASKKRLLEKNLKQITGFVLRKNGGDFGTIISRLKAHVYSEASIIDYRRADLPQLERALTIARSLLEKQ
jgi:superfamily II DNA or RNA helicase